MKKKDLTKKLIIASIVWLTLICIGIGAYVWLDDDITYLTEQTAQEKAQLIAKKQELENTAKNIKNSELAMNRFIDFAQSDDNKKDFFRKKSIVKQLGDITNELRTVKLNFIMQPFVQYAALPSSDKVDVVYSKVTISYEALTDITAFKILKLISEKLNGTVYYKNFTIVKMGEIDSDVLLKISEGNFPSLVKGTIDFDWISIRLKQEVSLDDIPKIEETEPQDTPATAAPVEAPQTEPAQPTPPLPAGGQNV